MDMSYSYSRSPNRMTRNNQHSLHRYAERPFGGSQQGRIPSANEEYYSVPRGSVQVFQPRAHHPAPRNRRPVSATTSEFFPESQARDTHRVRVNNSELPIPFVPPQPVQPPYSPTRTYQYSCDRKGYLNFETGLILKGRYKLEKRIGKGTFSKVFAALDLATDSWVAVKVVRNAEKYQLAAKVELHILSMIVKADKEEQSNCIHIIDQFVFHGHPCFVFDLLGRNLYSFLHSNRYMPFALSHVKSFVRQILEAVQFLHRRNVIFTDLKPENIVFVFDKTVKRLISGMEIEIPKDTRIRLIDFGSALYGDRHHTHLVQTRHYRAPEVILGIPWQHQIDIWSVGCIILELLTGRMIFNTHDSVDHLNQMERLIGPMPQSLKRKAANFAELFHNDFTLRMETARVSPTQCVPLQDYFCKVLHMYPKLEHLQDLVRRMLQWAPSDRISAAEALNHPYFTDC